MNAPRLQWTPADARRARYMRSTRDTWGRYMVLGMSRHQAFAPEQAGTTLAGFQRAVVLEQRELLSAQDYLDQLERERQEFSI